MSASWPQSTGTMKTTISDAERLSAFYANAAYDFYGTPSNALCVYKNGDAWTTHTWPMGQRISREARGVHGHPMQPDWRELGQRIYALLDDYNVRWTSIDAVAFAEAGEEKFIPLVIWIGVEPASLEYKLANTSAEAVTFFLTQAGFSDFEIAFRESVVTPLIGGPRMLPFSPSSDLIPDLRKPFTPTLGLAIAPLKTPHFEGSSALYFRESKESKRIFLLTCAHVARPPPAFPSNKGLRRKNNSQPREYIIALGDSAYAASLENMEHAVQKLHGAINDCQPMLRNLGDPEEGEPKAKTIKRNEYAAFVEGSRERINEINKFYTEIVQHWTIPNQRIIGEVIHVDQIAVIVQAIPDQPITGDAVFVDSGSAKQPPPKFSQDWALIELYESKFDWTNFKGNQIYIGGNISTSEYGDTMFPQPDDRLKYARPDPSLLQASGLVPANELHESQQLESNGDECFLVVKNGLTTGTTIGRMTGMESFTRIYKDHDIRETSIGIPVLPYGTRKPFSAPGDSGSIVLDRKGRIVGMITSGAGSDEDIDVTYLTPYWYIEQEIKKHFPDCVLYDIVG